MGYYFGTHTPRGGRPIILQDKTRQDKIIYVFECYHLSYCCGQISPYDNDADDDENDDDDNDNENNNNNKTVQNPCQ